MEENLIGDIYRARARNPSKTGVVIIVGLTIFVDNFALYGTSLNADDIIALIDLLFQPAIVDKYDIFLRDSLLQDFSLDAICQGTPFKG